MWYLAKDLQVISLCHGSAPATLTSHTRVCVCVCVSCVVLQITVHRGDDCTLLNNSQPYKWKVRNPKGGEATMPSVCFLVPPTNKEAVESVTE